MSRLTIKEKQEQENSFYSYGDAEERWEGDLGSAFRTLTHVGKATAGAFTAFSDILQTYHKEDDFTYGEFVVAYYEEALERMKS